MEERSTYYLHADGEQSKSMPIEAVFDFDPAWDHLWMSAATKSEVGPSDRTVMRWMDDGGR